jgi:beta-aspartyl-peptidase (threonine type)
VVRSTASKAAEIVIAHGGVDVPLTAAYQATVNRAALAGAARLSATPLDAVESAIVVMEDDPAFNAGAGAVLNRDGVVELDALIIDGATGRAGAVAAIQSVTHPISVARRVAEATPYVLLVGDGATAFARAQGFPKADCSSVAQHAAWKRMNDVGSLSEIGLNPFTGQPDIIGSSDTVGCIVNTAQHTAAGVSTGGLFFKAPGRVGDSAIIGAGAFASLAGAVAGTGLGEAFLELLLCRRVGQLLEMGVHPQLAVEEAIAFLREQRDGVGGIIAVDRMGRIGIAHNGTSLAVAAVINGELCPVATQHS